MTSPTFSSLANQTSKSSNSTTHSHTRKPSASNPIVRPGPNAEGPKGFEERLNGTNSSSSSTAQEAEPSSSPKSSGFLKEKVRKVGEKLALVEPRNEAALSGQRGEAARQDASTMPE